MRRMKPNLLALAGAALLAANLPAAAVTYSIGDFTFDENAFVTDVVSFNGTAMNDGSSWVNPLSSPGNATDIDVSTYLSTGPFGAGYSSVSLGLRFGNWKVVDGPGDDVALFFAGDQSGNEISVMYGEDFATLTNFSLVSDPNCFNTTTESITCYIQVGGVNVPLYVATFDIGPYYDWIDEITLFMTQNSQDAAVVFTLAAAIHASPVPVPAAVWLFGSGLLGLVAVARRRRR